MAKHEYRIEFNDFESKADECLTTVLDSPFSDPEKAAEVGWQLMKGIAKVHDAEIENQGDQFMVYRREGTYNQETTDGVVATLRILDESGEPYDL